MAHQKKIHSDDSYTHQITELLIQKNRPKLEEQLGFFRQFHDKTKARILFEISMSDNDEAYFALNQLIGRISDNTHDKNSVLDICLDKSRSCSMFILPFIEHASTEELKKAVPVLASILLTETDTHILQKSLYAIGETRDPSCINVVADFIFYDHEELKREAVRALGKIGGAAVLKRLTFASQTSKKDTYMLETIDKVKSFLSYKKGSDQPEVKQFASRQDTLENLSEDSSLSKFIHLLDSDSPYDRNQAIDGLIDLGPQAIPAVSSQIDFNDPNAIINGLDILANIRSEATLPAILKVLHQKHPDSNVRFAAYEAISRQPGTHSSISLIDGITDPVEQVRLAAATAINSNMSETMVAGLKSKIETSGRKSKRQHISSAIIDSHAGNIFLSLMDSDAFVFHATEYLAHVHESTLSFFTDIMIKRGRKSLAHSILGQAAQSPPKSNPLNVYSVDDSSICLKYYIRLFHSMGHNPCVFSQPQKALEAIEQSPPDLVTTDLNMLSMNGLEFVHEIRKIPSMKDLPVVVVTTQSDFIDQFPDSGLSAITHAIHKPLDSKAIKPFLKQKP